jgi:hypothetical protein
VASLGLEVVGGMEDIFGGDYVDEDEEGVADADSEGETGGSDRGRDRGRGGGGRGRGAGKFAKGTSSKTCRRCKIDKGKNELTGAKAFCKLCWPDYEAAKTDAIRQQEHTTFQDIDGEDDLLNDCLDDWVKNTPPSRGAGSKRGGYKFAIFKNKVLSRQGIRRGNKKTMKAFIDLMECRGKDKLWGASEFERRSLGNTGWKTGVDKDTKLPTVQCHVSSEEEQFEVDAMEDEVAFETKRVAATKKNASMLLEDLAAEPSAEVVQQAFKDDKLVDIIPEYSVASKTAEAPTVAGWLASKLDKKNPISGASIIAAAAASSHGGPSPSKGGRVDDYNDVFSRAQLVRDKKVAEFHFLQCKIDSLVNDMQEGVTEGKALETAEPAIYKTRVVALATRLKCLLWVAVEQDSDLDEYRRKLQVEMEGLPECELLSLPPFPMHTMRELKKRAACCGNDVATAKALNSSVETLRNCVAPINVLVAACTSAIKGINSAIERLRRLMSAAVPRRAPGS